MLSVSTNIDYSKEKIEDTGGQILEWPWPSSFHLLFLVIGTTVECAKNAATS